MSGKLQTVHVRVNDAATGRPTPVRLRITDAQGSYYAPFGRQAAFPTEFAEAVGGNVLIGREAHAYIDGTCEIALPPGRLSVAIAKGPEYTPIHEAVVLAPGKLALRFTIQRWADLRAEGWYSGDTRSHFLSPHAALLEGAAEDVAVVNLLAWELTLHGAAGNYRALPGILDFSGQRPALEAPGHMVVVNTLNRHETLGQLLLLNCHRVVYPLTAGGPDGFDGWTLADWCDQCHRKGGLVVGDGFFGQAPAYHGELLADLILGRVDTLQLGEFENPGADRAPRQESLLTPWYQLLDCGLRIPLAAGSGKDSNRMLLGAARTYALLEPGQPLTYKNWIEAVRAGRTFITSGPLLTFTVNEQPPGAVLDLPVGTATVRVRAEVRSLRSLQRLEVVANSRVVAAADVSGTPAQASVEVEVPLPQGGWLAARCWGPYDAAVAQWHAAQSSPVYVHVGGKPPPPDRTALDALADSLQRTLLWVEQTGRCDNDAQRQRLATVFREAQDRLAQLAEDPAP